MALTVEATYYRCVYNKKMSRPSDLFDREWEWEQLLRFARNPRPEMTLGLVWGRRRQGKSLLLQALTDATAGFRYEAIEGNGAEILRDLAAKLGAFLGSPAPVAFATIDEALLTIARLSSGPRPRVVVLDEFPLMAAAFPTLPSLVRKLLGPGTETRGSRARLILCGSAVGFMGKLLGFQAPLRGRAGLELVVQPFDFRVARRFWNIRDLTLAVRVFSVVGGTPAYRRELSAQDAPKSARDFDDWVVRTALNPSVPLFHEGRHLLLDDPSIGDRALYHSVLAAIAAGETTSARIASRLARPATSLAHPLDTLTEAGFVIREVDAFHAKKSHYAITEPLIAFHDAIVRPAWSELERAGRAPEVWRRSQATFQSRVVGPTFETLCRTWVTRFASPQSVGGPPRLVTRGLVPDAEARVTRDVDVVALGEGRSVRLLGEAKWGELMHPGHLEGLRRVKQLLGLRGYDVSETRLGCFSAKGFTEPLTRLARHQGILLVDLRRLYEGS